MAGTDLTIDVSKAPAGSSWGYTARPGSIAHWPGGLCLCFPPAGSVNGTLVLDRGDVNLTFKRYLESPVHLTIDDDYITDIAGDGLDARLMESYFEAWGDREAYATSHVGWGMNHGARYEALAMYDRRDTNGTEQRAFAGNFLYSTGANEFAGRHTRVDVLRYLGPPTLSWVLAPSASPKAVMRPTDTRGEARQARVSRPQHRTSCASR